MKKCSKVFSVSCFTISPKAANVFFLIDASFLNADSHWQNTWKPRLHTTQANTRSWPQLAYSCQLVPFLVRRSCAAQENCTDTHVTNTCVIHFTNVYFSSSLDHITVWSMGEVQRNTNDWCSMWNKAFLGLIFTHAASVSSECSGCCLLSSLWSAVIMVRGCGEDFLLDVGDFAAREALWGLHASPHSHSKAESSPAC